MAAKGRIGQRIRATHPYGFRCGEWAVIVGVGQDGPRELYCVRFNDGTTDFWPVTDPDDPYEISGIPTPMPGVPTMDLLGSE